MSDGIYAYTCFEIFITIKHFLNLDSGCKRPMMRMYSTFSLWKIYVECIALYIQDSASSYCYYLLNGAKSLIKLGDKPILAFCRFACCQKICDILIFERLF